MKLVNIRIKNKEGQIIDLKEAYLMKDKGIEGDVNAKGGNRQISILSLDTRKSIEDLEDKGLCIARFYENLTIEDLKASELYIGQKIKLGNAKVEISQIGKACFSTCRLVKRGINCDLSIETIFAKVVERFYCYRSKRKSLNLSTFGAKVMYLE